MKIKMTQPPANRKTAEYPERFKAENGSYICNTLLGCDITVPEGNRVLDSAFIRLSRNTLNRKYTNNAIWIMDPARQNAQELEVTVWAKGEGRLQIGTTVFQLTDALTPYSINVKGCRNVKVEALDGDVTLTTYTTKIIK